MVEQILNFFLLSLIKFGAQKNILYKPLHSSFHIHYCSFPIRSLLIVVCFLLPFVSLDMYYFSFYEGLPLMCVLFTLVSLWLLFHCVSFGAHLRTVWGSEMNYRHYSIDYLNCQLVSSSVVSIIVSVFVFSDRLSAVHCHFSWIIQVNIPILFTLLTCVLFS